MASRAHSFCSVHQTLLRDPWMEAKFADHLWTIRELLAGRMKPSAVVVAWR
jgi:hypothetical protein